MRNIDLVQLEVFKTVVDEGGITKAAAKLHRVQSNISTRLKQLETRLGTALFYRRNRKLVLSPDGRTLLAYAERLLRLSSEAEAALRDGTPRGTFRLGALESTAATRLPPVLSRYHAAYPDVRIELVTGTTGALLTRVLHQDVDAAFVAEPFNPEGLDSQPAFQERLVLITPKGFAKIRTPRDIERSTIIAFGAGCTYRRRLEEWLARARVAPAHVMEFASYHAIVACVAAGAGVALVPQSVILAAPCGVEVVIHPVPAETSRARTMLVWRAAERSIAVDALLRQLAHEVPGSARLSHQIIASGSRI